MQWFAVRRYEINNFENALYTVLLRDKPASTFLSDYQLVQGAIATPRQIAEAALAVWGISEEGEAK